MNREASRVEWKTWRNWSQAKLGPTGPIPFSPLASAWDQSRHQTTSLSRERQLSGEDELKMMEENRDRLQTMSFSIEVWRRQRTMTGLSFWWLQRNWVDQEGAEKQKSSALEAQQQWLQNGGRSPLVFFTCAQRQRPGPNQNPQI
jgi:hypothetical protein